MYCVDGKGLFTLVVVLGLLLLDDVGRNELAFWMLSNLSKFSFWNGLKPDREGSPTDGTQDPRATPGGG